MKIYNTLTNRKEELIPLKEDEVGIYVCGPTVYNYFHIGNARPFVVFDTLRRYLEYLGKKVNFVQNFTDVDDKIIARAGEEGLSSLEVGEKYIKEYFADAKALGVRPATHHPKVTDNMKEIIEFVEGLIEGGHAYESDGDVYFDTDSFKDYGKLSGQDLSELKAGARVDISERKKNPLDFALWKRSKEGEDLSWDSPWGKGRPGWHIECSTMAKKYIGNTIDVHAGGQDLIFPHHENEIAQSEAAGSDPFANYWMHNGYITVRDEEEGEDVKMSKSKGNFFTVRDILKEYDGEVIRYFLLAGHYRSPIVFDKKSMQQSRQALARMHNAKETLEFIAEKSEESFTGDEKAALAALSAYRDKFIRAMDDDLNTADAVAAIFELIADVNKKLRDGASREYAKGALSLLLELTGVLGLLEEDPPSCSGVGEDGKRSAEDDVRPTSPDGAGHTGDIEIEVLIEERAKARADKNWARADEIRDQLAEKGITLKDTPQGVQIIRE